MATSFLEEKKYLQSLLKEHSINIEHIGSTAIPGLSAKPIIDILMVVKDSETIDDYTKELSALGYESKGERGVIGNRYFKNIIITVMSLIIYISMMKTAHTY